MLQDARAVESQKCQNGAVDLQLKTTVPNDLLANQPNITKKPLNSMMSETFSDGYAPESFESIDFSTNPIAKNMLSQVAC